MRGDQLARQWPFTQTVESTCYGLTVAETTKREETGIRTVYRDLEALPPPFQANQGKRKIDSSINFLRYLLSPIAFNWKNKKGIFRNPPFASLAPLREREVFGKKAKRSAGSGGSLEITF